MFGNAELMKKKAIPLHVCLPVLNSASNANTLSQLGGAANKAGRRNGQKNLL